MIELVKWSFALPILAILIGLGAHWIAVGAHMILTTADRTDSEDRHAEMFAKCGQAGIGCVRARTHAH
jgi:hypothetical protein